MGLVRLTSGGKGAPLLHLSSLLPIPVCLYQALSVILFLCPSLTLLPFSTFLSLFSFLSSSTLTSPIYSLSFSLSFRFNTPTCAANEAWSRTLRCISQHCQVHLLKVARDEFKGTLILPCRRPYFRLDTWAFREKKWSYEPQNQWHERCHDPELSKN